MTHDLELNAKLKQMWAIKEKKDREEPLTNADIIFWDKHLQIIKDYYQKNAHLWYSQGYIANY